MALKRPQLLLLSSIALVALVSDSVSADFCPISSSQHCPSCAFLGQANCTPPMLMAPKSGDTKDDRRNQNIENTNNKDATGVGRGAASSSSGIGQQENDRTADGGNQSQTSGKDTPQNFSCKVANAEVDWFIAIKKPRSHEYAFLSPEHPANWQYAGDITSQGPVFDTLSQARDNPDSVAAYNDKPPNMEPNGTFGHLKGLFMRGQSAGFWMMYSARNFPSFDPVFSFRQGENFAQSFICITTVVQQLNEFSRNLANSEPRYYHKERFEGPAGNKQERIIIHQFQSKGGQAFNIFIKGKNSSSQCIYQNIHQQYNTSGVLRVQSWLRTLLPDQRRGPRASRVKNIESIRMTVGDGPWEWNNTDDHSKWCVSMQPSAVCFSDLNRMGDQLTQGGAAVCLQHGDIWRAFNALVDNMYTSK